MASHDVAFIGTGADPENPDASGFAMAYWHAVGYEELDSCELVACADLVRENAEAFADAYDVDPEHVYEDSAAMLAEARPDVVSVCTPPATHEELVVETARADSVEAIHCEKPMADTWGGARRMVECCREEGVQLTFNHQRRFSGPWATAKELLEEGAIGELRRLEIGPPNLYDWGTHSLDLCGFYNGEAAAEWVLCGLDYSEENVFFGAHNENQTIVQARYENGVDLLAATGGGNELVGAHHRLVGTDGAIEVRVHDGPDLRVRRDGDDDWEVVEVEAVDDIAAGIADLIAALEAGRESELSAERALTSTEIIFAAWESARRRGRVDLPLEIEDNPLDAMVEAGDLTPEPAE